MPPLLASPVAEAFLVAQVAAQAGRSGEIHGPCRVGHHRRGQDIRHNEQIQGMREVHGTAIKDFGLTGLFGG
jgi:hypothetical protein